MSNAIKKRFKNISINFENLKNKKFKDNIKPIDENCKCSTCQNYNCSYIHHLLKSEELLGLNLITGHNIFFIFPTADYY